MDDPKQRNQRNRRRQRAARMQKQAAQGKARMSGEEGDESPARQKSHHRPPNRKKRNKESIVEEDIIDGFAILSFRSYEDLEVSINSFASSILSFSEQFDSNYETTIKTLENNRMTPDPVLPAQPSSPPIWQARCGSPGAKGPSGATPAPPEIVQPKVEQPAPKVEKCKNIKGTPIISNVKPINNNHVTPHKIKNLLQNDATSADELVNCRTHEETNGPLRTASREHLSDVSSHSSSGRGYMCDSESEDERGSDAGSDLFSANAIKREPSVLRTEVCPTAPSNGPTCRSPASSHSLPLLSVAVSPLQNGPSVPPLQESAAATTTTVSTSGSAAATFSTAGLTVAPKTPREHRPVSSPLPVSPPPPSSLPLPSPQSAAVVSHLYSPAASLTPVNYLPSVEKPAAPPALSGPLAFLSESTKVRPPSPNVSVPSSLNSSSSVVSVSSQNCYTPSIHTNNHSKSGSPPPLPFHLNHSVSNHLNSYPPKKNILSNNCATNGQPTVIPPPIPVLPPPAPLYSPLSPHPYPRPASPLLTPASVPLKSSYASPVLPPSLSSSPVEPPVVTTNSVIISARPTPIVTSSSSNRVPSPVVSTPHPTTPTPSLGRDSHSSSSISSLSQLSQSLHSNKEGGNSSSGGSSRSRSSSRNNTPCVSSAALSSIGLTSNANCCTYSNAVTYGAPGGSLTSLVFSKPSWGSANPIINSINGPHLTPPLPPRPTPPSPNQGGLPLPPSLHNSHHSSPFGPHPGGPPSLHPSGPHSGIFAPPMPPASSLTPSSLTPSNLSLGPSSASAPFSAETLFSQPNQDLLRRELDTRFLASQDRSIPIPPPPYMRAEMHQHQHQHTHMHSHSPFLPPPLGGSLVPQASPHLYDKFAKLDSPFYSRNSLGLPGYPGLSPLLGPTGNSGTPFTPAGHLAAFQPKMNPLVKSKNMKSGRWCAMHVRIAWEIYHHQQKQQQAEVHKSGNAAAAASVPGKSPADLLRPPGHLFPPLPRPHDIGGLPSSLLAASASGHVRSFDTSPHHNSFLTPGNPTIGVSPYARPGFPGFGGPGSSFGGLGSLGLAGASLFGNRDLRASCLPGLGPSGAANDSLYQLHHRTPPNFSTGPPQAPPHPSAAHTTNNNSSSSASWGGLKAEAERERERMHREEQEQREREREHREREKQRKAELEKERREKELEKSREIERRERELERQKERDRESRMHHHHHHYHHQQETLRNGDLLDRSRDRERDRERDWERLRERKEVPRSPLRKNDSSAFENNSSHPPKPEVKVKQEKKDEELHHEQQQQRHHERRHEPLEHPPNDYLRTLGSTQASLAISLERARLMRTLPERSLSHFWGALPPPPPTTTATAGMGPQPDPFRDYHHQSLRDRELLQRYMMPISPHHHHERFREVEMARQMDLDRQLQLERQAAYDRSKLAPPPLRPNEAPNFAPNSSGLFPSLPPSAVPPHVAPLRNKSNSPSTGIPPPLIPCSGSGTIIPNSSNQVSSSPSLHHKLGLPPNSLMESSHENYFKDRRDMNLHSTEIDSQSR